MSRWVVEDDVESKAWDPDKHPRDKNGRFASIGKWVKLPDGSRGRVLASASRGRIEVSRADGSTEVVKANKVEVQKPPAPGSRSGVPRRVSDAERRERDATGNDYRNSDGEDSADVANRESDAAYLAHTKKIEKVLSEKIKAGQTTDKLYTLDGQGRVWAPERAKIHKEIVDDLYKRAKKVPRDGKSVIAGGLGGAGKSTVLGKHAGVQTEDYLTINPDDIKEIFAERDLIPEIEGLSPMEASALVHEESSHVANMLAQRAYGDKRNVVWDITMSSRGSVERRIAEMRAAGYGDVSAVFVDIPVETSVERALARHRRGMEKYDDGEGPGGRYVPPAIIRKNAHSSKSSANRDVFDILQDQFDSWQLFDNSGKSPKRVGSGGKVSSLEWSKEKGRYVAQIPGLDGDVPIRVHSVTDPGGSGQGPDMRWSVGATLAD